MHPTIERYMMKAWITDLHRQAERNRMACAASRTPRTRREKRKAEPHARSHGRSRAPRAHHEPQRACPMADAMIARPGCQPYPCSPTVTSGPEGRVRERAAMLAIRAARLLDGLCGTAHSGDFGSGRRAWDYATWPSPRERGGGPARCSNSRPMSGGCVAEQEVGRA